MNDRRWVFFGCLVIVAMCSPSSAGNEEVPALTPAPVDESGGGATWLARHTQKIEESRSMDPDILFVGDSIIHEWETTGARVWKEYYGDRGFNLGFSGDRTEHVLWRLQNGAVEYLDPKVTVLLIGTNNTGHRMDPASHTARGIETIVRELNRRLPGSRVLLLGIFPRNSNPQAETRVRNEEINARIEKLSDGKRIHFLDLSSQFTDETGVLLDSVMPDSLHPNEEGYRQWASAMKPTLDELLK